MKKLISLALTLAILASLAIGVSAETAHLVGERSGTTGQFADGDTYAEFAATNPTYDVNISVTAGAVQNRYAVDILYDSMTLAITGSNMVWDVNSLEYVIDPSKGTDAGITDTTFNVTITNYSDKPVYMTATVTDKSDVDGVKIASVDEAGLPASYSKHVIPSAVGTTTGSPIKFGVKVSAETTWADVANHYKTQLSTEQTILIATCKITIDKDA